MKYLAILIGFVAVIAMGLITYGVVESHSVVLALVLGFLMLVMVLALAVIFTAGKVMEKSGDR